VVRLSRQTPAGEAESREHQGDHRENGRDPAKPALKPGDRRRQHEREKDGDGERHEHGLCPVQDRNDEHTAGEGHPRLHSLQRTVLPCGDVVRFRTARVAPERQRRDVHASSGRLALPDDVVESFLFPGPN